MSRFFASGDTDSESEEENVEEEEEVQEEAPGPNRFDFESSESEEEHRVVRSEKDKRFEGLQNTIKLMKNHIKINDWMAINKDYDALLLLVDKAGKVIAKEGVPKFFLKQLTDLDTLTEKTFKDKDTKAKMNKNNAQGLAAVRQKLRKAKDKFKKELEAYQKDPLKDDAPDDDDDDDGQADKKDKSKKKPKKGGDAEDKGDGEGDESDAEKDSGSESDVEVDEILKNQQGAMFDRNFWVKKPLTEEQIKKQEAAEAKKLEKKRRQQNRPVVKVTPVRTDEDLKKKEEEKVTPEMVVKRLKEVLADRGKRGTDKLKTIEELKFLATKTTIPVTLLKIKTCLAAALFDVSLNSGQHMETGHWRECYDCLFDILDQLTENKTLRLSEDEEVKDSVEEEMLQQAIKSKEEQKQAEEVKQKTAAAENKESKEVKTPAVDAKIAARQAAEEKEDYSGQVQAGKEGEVLYVIGNLYAFVLRMVAEFRAALQNTDPHSEDYIVRLKDEPLLLNLVTKVQSYYTTIKKTHLEAQVAMLRLELIYWHYAAALDVQKQAIDLKSLATAHPAAVGARVGVDSYKSDASHPASLSLTTGSGSVSGKEEKEGRRGPMKPDPSLVVPLATLLYRQADKRLSTRALLCHIYHLALHNKYQEAHDLLLMSHVQETIEGADIPTRILFNRAMAQIGLCAFRIGEFRQSLYCLADLYQSSRIKELLAQGQSQSQRYQEKDEQEERAEKLRQYPFHMHINLDLIESAHLISAMLAEVPNFAMHGQANKKRLISKSFRRLWEYHQKQPFNGPPETTRDLIMAASKALMTGDWKKTQQFLLKLRMWNLVRNGAEVKANLQAKVQEEALRTYLLTYSGHYQTLSLKFLCDMFELPSKAVHKMASKMMVNEQLAGAWDQPSATIVMHPVDQSRLQKAALKFVDRATQFVEQNERMLDPRSGFFKDDYRDRDRERPQGLGLGGERDGGYYRDRDNNNRGGEDRDNRDNRDTRESRGDNRDSSERDGGRPQRRDRDFVRRKWRDNYRERDRGGDRERGGDRSSYQQYQQYQEPADGKQ